MTTLSPGRMQVILIALSFCSAHYFSYAQSIQIDTAYIDNLYNHARNIRLTKADSAAYYMRQVDSLSQKTGYRRGEAYAAYGFGLIEEVLYKKFQYYTQSLHLFENLNDQFGIGLNLVHIGNIYSGIGQKEKAMDYYRQALEVKKKIDDYGGIALTLINMGHYYQGKNRLEEALSSYEESLEYRLKEGSPQGIAFSQVNIASVYMQQNRYEDALEMAEKSVQNFSTTTNWQGQIWAQQLKGRALIRLGKEKEAEETLLKIVQYPSYAHYNNYTLLAKKALIDIYSKRGEVQRAFQLQSEYVVAKDTLAKRDYRIETQRMVNEYEFRMDEERALEEKAKDEQRLARRNSLEYLGIAIVVVLLFVLLYSGRKKFTGTVTDGLLLITLLLFFEFLLILTDSSVDRVTGGEPVLKLLVNLGIALIILPGHRFLEKHTRRRLIRQELL